MTPTTPHTPTPLSYDGFGINGSDEFKSRLLTWANVSGDHVLLEEERTQLGQQLVHRYNTHAALVAALREASRALTDLDPLADHHDATLIDHALALAQEDGKE